MKNRMRVPKGLTPRQFDFEMLDMMGATDEQLAAFMTKAEIKEYHAYIEGKAKAEKAAGGGGGKTYGAVRGSTEGN